MNKAILLALLLSGCASSSMQAFVGQPLQVAMVKHGPPSNAFDMPDGTRAFQWVIGRSYTPPVTVQNSGSAYPIGRSVNWYQQTRITGGQPIYGECTYTMFAKWNDSAWVFTGYQKPRWNCE